MGEWLAPLLVLAGVVVSSYVTWVVAKRNASGTVATSEAAQLWEESNKLRTEYKERAEKLERQLEEVNAKLDTMTVELQKLRGTNDIMVKKIDELKTIIKKLRDENDRLLQLKKDGPLEMGPP